MKGFVYLRLFPPVKAVNFIPFRQSQLFVLKLIIIKKNYGSLFPPKNKK